MYLKGSYDKVIYVVHAFSTFAKGNIPVYTVKFLLVRKDF
jgi:hypothetical protein